MFQTTLKKISSIVSGRLYKISDSHANTLMIQKVSTDSRDNKRDSIFIAIKGKIFDGHCFAEEAVKKGSLAILSESLLPINKPQIIVKSTIHAIERIAHWIRKKSRAKFIAITGSSGKTSVKEMTTCILAKLGLTISTKENYNNNLGVLLTLLRVSELHRYVVIEIGASKFKEIQYSSSISNPDVALINNLFAAHLEGFESFSKLSKEKSEILHGLSKFGTAIINLDNNDIKNWKNILKDLYRIRFFSLKKKGYSHFYATDIYHRNFFTQFNIHTPFGTAKISNFLMGLHSVSNALASAAISISVGASVKQVEQGLNNFKPIHGRIYPLHISPNKIILDDTYNSNFGSMIAAIDVLSEMTGYRVLVVGDMLELGEYSSFYHKKISRIVQHKKINRVISFGIESVFISRSHPNGTHFFSQEELMKELVSLIVTHDEISMLIKGSRRARMENIINDICRRESL
ncbi:UDP-N-acetylmuramoyl-tripeptide--D-alanyl-D-alanine ligase [Candidatus Riesia pediculischaeffi]|uniref:UDP-N-acetylmuramoyl-tripeptide--D-alanyl-D-alanine ligase n=1 Tax=Candidatus Riesia pediculischaeffi PTSU TaxID=1401651 RepID=A0A0C1SA74_9ENTR|nr:UDP-N-acetylmuramoyl-tripeptide--D-alanyl-D-alanine ligase [Candidatus Riesia pediculischaeffi]KIE64181.1 UDP-N-acetylmuramoylalanyl-D-glutamyl-2,6- diaminopimelate--D-alanyl-D-alanine ligase [Candidatus Riesia pediculischaeffi PTSU]